MKKNNIVSFYIINILAALLESILIGYFSYAINSKILTGIITGVIWLILGIISFVFLKTNQKIDVFKEKQVEYNNEKFQKEFDDILSKSNSYLNKNIEYIYSDILMNPAGALSEEMIIVNPKFLKRSFNKKIIKGLIGHEIGHIMSGLIKHSPITFIHFGAIFQFLFYIPMMLCVKNERKFKIIIILLLLIAIPLNITNYLSIFYYYRKDEHYANYNANLLSTAEELRTYYHESGYQTLLLRISDVKHPSVKSMLKKLDLWMGKNDFEKRIYLADGEIYQVDNNGLDLTKDEMKFKYYRHHRHDSTIMATKYADCIFNGEGTKKDLKKALNLYEEINTEDAKHMVGMCYILSGEENKGYEELKKNLDYPYTRLEFAKKYYIENRDLEALKMVEGLDLREAKVMKKKILMKLEEKTNEGENNV